MKYPIKSLKPVLCTGLFLLIYHAVGTAQAIEVVDPVRAMAAQCSQCHGMEGNDFEGFDDLNGEPYNEIYDELVDMLDSSSSENELMVHQAKGYTEEQIDALAYYFSEQPKMTVSDAKSEEISVDEKDEKDEEDEEDE